MGLYSITSKDLLGSAKRQGDSCIRFQHLKKRLKRRCFFICTASKSRLVSALNNLLILLLFQLLLQTEVPRFNFASHEICELFPPFLVFARSRGSE